MRTHYNAVAGLTLLLVTALIAGPALAQDKRPPSADDQKKATALQDRAQRIDAEASKNSTPEGQKRVAGALAKEFKVPESTVTDLRDQKKLGFGEIAITLGLAQELAKRDHLSMNAAIDQIMAKRQAGEGWGKIAHDLNLKLGRVVSDVHRAEKKVAAVERAEGKPDRAGKAEKNERVEKADRPDRPDKPDKMDRPERPERAERPGRR